MADIRVSPKVKQLIGAEIVSELQGPAYQRYSCWACGLGGRTGQATSVVALRYGNRAAVVKLAHARCAGSQVIAADGDLWPAKLATARDMMAIAAVLPYPGRVMRPVLALEARAETFAVLQAGDQVNLQVWFWLRRGMTLLTAADQLPGWARRWRLRLPDRRRARLTGPWRMLVYDGECDQPDEWAELVAETKSCVVLIGTIGLYAADKITADRFPAMLDAAARAGSLAGALVQVHDR